MDQGAQVSKKRRVIELLEFADSVAWELMGLVAKIAIIGCLGVLGVYVFLWLAQHAWSLIGHF